MTERDETKPVIVGTLAAYKAWTVLKAAFVPVDPVVFTETFLRAMSPTILASVEPGHVFAFDVDPTHVFRLEREGEGAGRPYICPLRSASGRRTYLHEDRQQQSGSTPAEAEPPQPWVSRVASATPSSSPAGADDDATHLAGLVPPQRSPREMRRYELYRYLRG